MLFAVGMYLPFATTFAIFVGGITKWVTDSLRRRRGYNEAQSIRVENVGILDFGVTAVNDECISDQQTCMTDPRTGAL